MQIQSGKLYENRTWKYLYPCLKAYGPELNSYLASFFKVGVGIGDFNIDTPSDCNCIFILIDTNIPLGSERDISLYKLKFAKFLDWLKYQYFYVKDYMYEDTSGKHMIVLKIPLKHEIAYVKFIQGEYFNMYLQKDLNEYFKYVTLDNKEIEKKRNEKIKNARNVLTKSKEYVPTFVEIVKEEFRTPKLSVQDLEHIELDFPPKLEEEIFNYEL
jgi:hypothetical protein